jgi:hypothetical protein
MSPSTSVDREYMTRAQLAEFLTARGFPISRSTLDKLSMPSRGEGPPAVGFWGNRALYAPDRGLAWAKRRFRTSWRGGDR